ncbi:hypothetical protein [Sorangium sp. So ce388]|uniref:hypothetical protein n=1 Tax=Sorangium sp. So ce388 TaxID=3133309 RepID=UPI003F5B08AE
MTQSDADKLKHLTWAVEARARNQRSALRLLALFTTYRAKWISQRGARTAQNLLAVTFSLWRAAFLADKKATRAEVFDDAVEFLERLIADNAISYPQDRKSNEWTFNFYTKNAKAALRELADSGFSLVKVKPYEEQIRTPIERWEYCQDLLDEAIAGIEAAVTAPRRGAKQAERARTKHAKKERRKISRSFTRKPTTPA